MAASGILVTVVLFLIVVATGALVIRARPWLDRMIRQRVAEALEGHKPRVRVPAQLSRSDHELGRSIAAFISYIREDEAVVLSLKHELERHGINCFMDIESIPPGEAWEATIRREIDGCDFFLACFSEHYVRRQSTWMNREIQIALERHRREPSRVSWIIPVLLAGDIPDLPEELGPSLRMLNWVSLSPDNWAVNLGRLLAAMTPGRDVRGAGVAELARRYSEARSSDRIDMLRQLQPLLDLPEAIALLEVGLLDPDDAVRAQAAGLLSSAGQEGAKVFARVLLNTENKDYSLRWMCVVGLQALHGKAACAAPALAEVLRTMLSQPPDSDIVAAANNEGVAAAIIALLAAIGESDMVRDLLTDIESDVPEIREAVAGALAVLR